MKKLCIPSILILLICISAAAETPEYTVLRATGHITLDGILDEGDWAAAPSFGDFAFPWWTSGGKEQTEVKMLWDDTFLYISFRCDDKHIWADHYTFNSSTYKDDCAELFWNPDPEGGDDYHVLEINCIGVPRSVRRSDRKTVMMPYIAQTIDGSVNDDGDTDGGWVLEVAIRFDEYPDPPVCTTPEPGANWRINLNRCGGKTNEQYSQWSPSGTAKPSFHVPEAFGTIVFSGEGVR